MVVTTIGAGILASLLGNRIIASRIRKKEPAIKSILLPTIGLFGLTSSHAFLDAPMNLTVINNNISSGAIIQPTYYVGAYHDEQYFPTKRVEAKLDLGLFDGSMIEEEGDFVLAGIGA